MNWKKLGLVFTQDGTVAWRRNSALTPTPFLLNDNVIRVYAGFRDDEGISRIGYVDVDSRDPTQVIGVSAAPVLDRGRDGCFDDNGVILGDVVRDGDRLRMYYVGFQLVKRAKFLAFTGLAESTDGGETFQRVSEAPVLDRSIEGNTIRAVHTVLFEEGVWKIWYAVGDDWQMINGVPYPKYNIWYAQSADGKAFPANGVLCVDVEGDEYRIGRPSVYKTADGYMMFYTKGGTSGEDYFPGVAYSTDGVQWQRRDASFGLSLGEQGFDDRHLCYPRLVTAGHRTFCFYNGNNMGAEGFGVAELLEA
ncbi:hypothetical protein CCOS865_01676 [Pseudomonas reidholzensis]|uniref:Glycosyl hydrolase family 32 N-terminal domain-containing protein n=1 Tax=Pseudomonas reidholzensis TaxID=1785162 RepID=A0A383RRN6_9PSED|nr:hypothetical protein [Pseudomonas reidholzensis]SYX89423.1 hypothetical protein CCOS865_01676 [Pseudomonas reidholzensis]